MANELLSLAYETVNPKKAIRLKECAQCLTFRVYPDGERKLHALTSCRVRLCPVCAWRRSLKVYYQVRDIMKCVTDMEKYSALMLTLTVKNVDGDSLSDTITHLMKSWQRFMSLKQVKKVVKGWYRGMEVTHNINPASESYDTYHPHFHCILVVNKSYFKSRDYMSFEAWQEAWRQSARLDYLPNIDIRKLQGDLNKAIAEVAKYSVKSNEYVIPDDWDLTVDTVRLLDLALDSRRFVAYGGLMKQIRKDLQQDDEDTGDLANVGEEATTTKEEEYQLVSYRWYVGFREYFQD